MNANTWFDMKIRGESMRYLRLVLLLFFVLFVSWPAHCQEFQEWEIFGGFDYLNVNAGSVTLTTGQTINLQQNAYGWHITAAENKTSWIGGIIDISGDYANRTVNFGTTSAPLNVRFNGQAYPFLFGPRFYYRGLNRITLFGEPTIGFAVARINVASASAVPELSGIVPETQTHWAYALGGGADYDVTDEFAVRIQADWIRSHFPETFYRDFQNNYRISGGVVFKF
jgi:opacity protein-like surface antigen